MSSPFVRAKATSGRPDTGLTLSRDTSGCLARGPWRRSPGLLWTPGYWGWGDNAFVFNEGYWGAQVGFYGGVNYGFGYGGVGYEGGEWHNGAFFYNRSVNNVTNITNVYTKTVIVNNVTVNQCELQRGHGRNLRSPERGGREGRE